VSVFDVLAQPVAIVLEGIHTGLTDIGLPAGSGWAWGLSIVLLTITVRILLFPLFVKQIKSQRRMQELSPKIKVLQAKHKGDRETLNTELMKLYKDHGTNPISGCLPLILQLPIFFALFRVMNEFKPHFRSDGTAYFTGKYGLSDHLIEQAAKAKVFGAPISAAFNSKGAFLSTLHGHATTVKIVAVVMIVTMGLSTFITQKQMMARTGPATDPQQAQVQKIMLYVLPFSFAIFGFTFPIGVLLYWLTTNIWSMGQQRYVIARMPPVVPGGAAPAGGKDSKGPDPKAPKDKGPKGAKGDGGPGSGPSGPSTPGDGGPTGSVSSSGSTVVATGGIPNRPGSGRPANRSSAGSRKNKSRKGGRR
jgi:YidC/Oxa1 family membrane protein insertase